MQNQITELTLDAEKLGAWVMFLVVRIQCGQERLVGWLVGSNDSIAKSGLVIGKS